MIDKLIRLSDELDQLGLYSSANSVDNIIKESLMGPSTQRIQQMREQSSSNHMHVLLDLLGLVPGIGEGADLANAALYLSEGITPQNLLMAGLSVISMVPTMGDVSKAVKYGFKLAPEMAAKIAQLILTHQGKAKAAFDKMKDAKISKYLTSYVSGGDLLFKYSDQMWNTVKEWLYKILDNKAKEQVQPTQPNPEEWAMGQLPNL